ncbi:MAG: aminomethyltransferase family protein, partial [Gammaproteobacteria bacterium]|nr:aminomethyltransferase family protein [Gammaproteobacteria bacterium]
MTISHEHFRQAIGRTPFHDRMAALSKTENWATWNCYKVPRIVDKLSTEYFAVRSGCAVMDLTPMEKYRILGQDARPYLDRLVTRDISNLLPGRVTYVVWCNDDGKVIDDGTLFQLNENAYRLCSQHHQLDWLLMSAAGFDVQIEVETHDVAALAVQGPTSYSVLTAAGIDGLGDLKPFGIRNVECRGKPVTVSRTGYTGDLGYELWTEPGNAETLWDAIFDVQGQYDIHAMGLDALEMVRIEAGFIMPGFDFNTANSTIRAGYDR